MFCRAPGTNVTSVCCIITCAIVGTIPSNWYVALRTVSITSAMGNIGTLGEGGERDGGMEGWGEGEGGDRVVRGMGGGWREGRGRVVRGMGGGGGGGVKECESQSFQIQSLYSLPLGIYHISVHM